MDPDGRKIIIGISTSNTLWGRVIGEHAFIMCIDEKNPKKSIMLDASGRYGGGRTADILDGLQSKITIDAYLKYFDAEETLTTFELKLTKKEEDKIRIAIGKIEGYSWLQCADRASEILNENFSSEIKKSSTPKGLMTTLQNYSKKHPDKVEVKAYDFKTNKEIKTDEIKE